MLSTMTFSGAYNGSVAKEQETKDSSVGDFVNSEKRKKNQKEEGDIREGAYPFLPCLRTMYAQLDEFWSPQTPDHVFILQHVQIHRKRLWQEVRASFMPRRFGCRFPFRRRHLCVEVLQCGNCTTKTLNTSPTTIIKNTLKTTLKTENALNKPYSMSVCSQSDCIYGV